MSSSSPDLGAAPISEVGRLHHIGVVLTVAAQDSFASTLATVLGAKRVDDGEDDVLDVSWQWLATPHSPILELLSPRSGSSTPISEFLARTGGGLHHLSFETDDLKACRARFEQQEIPMTAYNPDHDGWAEFFLHPRATFGAVLH